MPSKLIVVGAFANCAGDVSLDDFLESLMREAPNLDVYRFHPTLRPGFHVKATCDWQAILSTAADLLAFATAIWTLYERYFKPKRVKSAVNYKPFLSLSLRRPDGTATEFTLGEEYTDKEVFIEQCIRQGSDILAKSGNETEVLASKIRQSEEWVRINVRSGSCKPVGQNKEKI